MTAAPRPALSVASSTVVSPRQQDGAPMRKNLAHNSRLFPAGLLSGANKEPARKWFARLLWKAFPGGSEREVAKQAALVLDVSERQVINWLRCENDAGVSYTFAVLILAGVATGLDSGRAA